MTTTEVAPADQAAVAALTRRLLVARVHQHTASIADPFTEDATLPLPGLPVPGTTTSAA
ncbi:hypothetical protein PV458_20490 [Streptomyces sp. MN03-5084-2B]|nr:hypothetical protein [Streptomyces sp. MN03-5084-2B]